MPARGTPRQLSGPTEPRRDLVRFRTRPKAARMIAQPDSCNSAYWEVIDTILLADAEGRTDVWMILPFANRDEPLAGV